MTDHDPPPEHPWSDLIESENGSRLTVPETGLYRLTLNVQGGASDTSTEIQWFKWCEMPKAEENVMADRLEEIEHRLQGARPGPWTTRKYPGENDVVRQTHWVTCEEPGHSDCAIAVVNHVAVVRIGHTDDDAASTAEFIAAAPEDTAWLVARVRTLESDLRTYGRHLPWCDFPMYFGQMACSCGLELKQRPELTDSAP